MSQEFRADNVGSLIRPPELLQARAAHAAGNLPFEGLRAAEDRAILDAFEGQRQSGIDIFTDGELRYDSERAGGFEPLRFAPRNKTVVLGLVTTKEPKLESQEALRRRIDEAAKFVPLKNLALSTQCGFASVAAGNLLSMDDQWRKLALVADTARKVWG